MNMIDSAASRLRVLFVLTSEKVLGPRGAAAGFEFSEVAHPWLHFVAQGWAVEFASPEGGATAHVDYDEGDPASRIFREGPGYAATQACLALADANHGTYDAIYIPGGLGPMIDLHHDEHLRLLLESAWAAGTTIGAVCHGVVALLEPRGPSGDRLIQGRSLTGFSAAEEAGHTDEDVPFILEHALRDVGSNYRCSTPGDAFVVCDGQLVTGQNPASAQLVARRMVEHLGARA